MPKVEELIVISQLELEQVKQDLKKLGHKTLADTLDGYIYLEPLIKKILKDVSEGLKQTSGQFNSDFNQQKTYIKTFDLSKYYL